MNCSRCNSERVLGISAHASDCFGWSMGNKSGNGYLPSDFGIGGGDDVEMEFCMDCGQIQGSFPLELTEFETIEPEKKWLLKYIDHEMWMNDKNQWSNFFDAKLFTEEEKENYRYYANIPIPPCAEWVEVE